MQIACDPIHDATVCMKKGIRRMTCYACNGNNRHCCGPALADYKLHSKTGFRGFAPLLPQFNSSAMPLLRWTCGSNCKTEMEWRFRCSVEDCPPHWTPARSKSPCSPLKIAFQPARKRLPVRQKTPSWMHFLTATNSSKRRATAW